MELEFDVIHHGDALAGLRHYNDTVTVCVRSGDPGGEDGEFEEHIRQAIAEWFDGAAVQPAKTSPEPTYGNDCV